MKIADGELGVDIGQHQPGSSRLTRNPPHMFGKHVFTVRNQSIPSARLFQNEPL